jgi:tetrapyrrole methylase family protein/MazG family protein
MVDCIPSGGARITIVGLGPGNPALLTREAWSVLEEAGQVYLRTSRHPTVSALPPHLVLHSFDHLYETVGDFSTLYDQMASEILAMAREGPGVLYAVPGHPLVGETSVQRILARARQEGLPVRLVDGLSFIEPVLSLLGIDGLAGLQLADATDLAAAHHPLLDPDRPALIGQLYSQRLASDVKLTLMNAYPDDHPVSLAWAAGTSGAALKVLPLYELDRSPHIDHLTSLYVPPLPCPGGLPAFQQTVASLRAPDGCPWDREQTHMSLRPHLLEESYEVLAALDEGDSDKLCEELGDLLMQIALHVQIASEEGRFRFSDVIAHIDAKLKRRHPHVFGTIRVRDSAEVLRNWEAIKRQEAEGKKRKMGSVGDLAQQGLPQQELVGQGSLAGIPAILPALARAQQMSDRAARAGFDWPGIDGVLDKLAEEVRELCAAQNASAVESELGDVLFTVVNVARWLQMDAESALRGACDRFARRYAGMERQAQTMGLDLADLPLAEQNRLWEGAKGA